MRAGMADGLWVERAVGRSVSVQRSRIRIENQVRQLQDAALALIADKGDDFTTQELVNEAGVALQTFYRYFASKDELVLAVLGDALAKACEQMRNAAEQLPDPLARLDYYITSTLERFGAGSNTGMMRFLVSARWRLHRQFPSELAEVEKPFAALLESEIAAAARAGSLRPIHPESDSWFAAQLIRSLYHYYTYVTPTADELAVVKAQLWRFCVNGLGATDLSVLELEDNS
ncbi:TetR/AcrR family transcriptional regulator [Mycobacterium syngnathidarum]